MCVYVFVNKCVIRYFDTHGCLCALFACFAHAEKAGQFHVHNHKCTQTCTNVPTRGKLLLMHSTFAHSRLDRFSIVSLHLFCRIGKQREQQVAPAPYTLPNGAIARERDRANE